jgi:hypothetical protein
MYHIWALTASGTFSGRFADHVRVNLAKDYLQVDATKHAGLPNNHQPSRLHINAVNAVGVYAMLVQL